MKMEDSVRYQHPVCQQAAATGVHVLTAIRMVFTIIIPVFTKDNFRVHDQ